MEVRDLNLPSVLDLCLLQPAIFGTALWISLEIGIALSHSTDLSPATRHPLAKGGPGTILTSFLPTRMFTAILTE